MLRTLEQIRKIAAQLSELESLLEEMDNELEKISIDLQKSLGGSISSLLYMKEHHDLFHVIKDIVRNDIQRQIEQGKEKLTELVVNLKNEN